MISRSTSQVISRSIYTIRQMLWDLPVSVSRFEYVPNQYCRADEEWSVSQEFSHDVWKKIFKCLGTAAGGPARGQNTLEELEVQARYSDRYPHYVEIKQSREDR